MKPFWVLENLSTTPRNKLFSVLGVDWLVTPYAWVSLLIYGVTGVVVALLIEVSVPYPGKILKGLVYGVLIFLANLIHTLGHLISGLLVRAPMDANLVTATFDVNLYYEDQALYSRGVHVIRALGGPLFNLLLGLAGVGAWTQWGMRWALIFGLVNLASGVWTLVPVKPLDGWELWRQLSGRVGQSDE